MDEIFSRNELYWGKDAGKILASKHAAVFGLGGVGGYCAEALARAGVGRLTIDDFELINYEPIKPQLKFELGI